MLLIPNQDGMTSQQFLDDVRKSAQATLENFTEHDPDRIDLN